MGELAEKFSGVRRTSVALAQAKGAIERAVSKVLVVCEQNTGRSQVAAVVTNALSDGAAHVRSAGSTPACELDLLVVAATGELGLDHHDWALDNETELTS